MILLYGDMSQESNNQAWGNWSKAEQCWYVFSDFEGINLIGVADTIKEAEFFITAWLKAEAKYKVMTLPYPSAPDYSQHVKSKLSN